MWNLTFITTMQNLLSYTSAPYHLKDRNEGFLDTIVVNLVMSLVHIEGGQ